MSLANQVEDLLPKVKRLRQALEESLKTIHAMTGLDVLEIKYGNQG